MTLYEIYTTGLQYNTSNGSIYTVDCTLNEAIKIAMGKLSKSALNVVVIQTLQSVGEYGNRKYHECGKVIRVKCDYGFKDNTYRYIWVTDKAIRELTKSGNFKR